uniref:Large ribosomal subunit protein bL9c n=1 Tax=Aegilops tauschii subsp. strangulata TaxID=200361 RepID=A0A453QB38_AEGTS
QTIDKLGKAGETVKVAPGHFRNYLMPKMLAVPNIDKFAILMREQSKLYKREEEVVVKEVSKEEDDARQAEEKLKQCQAAAKRLDNALLVFRRFISEGIELRSPVTKDEIVSEVARQLNVNIYPDNLHLVSPLSSLGEFEVPLRLPRDIPRPEGKLQWTLKVKIRRP